MQISFETTPSYTRMHILSCLCIREIYDYRHKIAFSRFARKARKKGLFLDENLEEKVLGSVSKKKCTCINVNYTIVLFPGLT